MGKSIKLCPFRKQVNRTVQNHKGGIIHDYKEDFCKCEGTRCMAFQFGTCQRLKQERK